MCIRVFYTYKTVFIKLVTIVDKKKKKKEVNTTYFGCGGITVHLYIN